MRFIQEFGFTVKVGQDEAHQRWLLENEEKLAQSHPEGTRYLGTFATVFSTDKQNGPGSATTTSSRRGARASTRPSSTQPCGIRRACEPTPAPGVIIVGSCAGRD